MTKERTSSMKMKEYKVRYKLFSRSRQTRTEKVRAANQFIAAAELYVKYWKYPIGIISVFPA